jgi:GTP-binding protein EngB required for normal cell division
VDVAVTTARLAALQRAEQVVDATSKMLRAEGRAAAASQLSSQLYQDRGSRPTIVVAGEDKRGKSTLINALLAQPELSPVGAKVVTGAPVRFFYSLKPIASVTRYGSDVEEAVEPALALSLATVDGNPGNEHNICSVSVGQDLALLKLMNIVDTPGVGGLNSGHAALTLQSLQAADALLFVLDAAAPMRANELTFLRRAAARLQTVILVVTKTDVYPGWRQILADDLKLLAEQAPRFEGCPAVGVSSVSALRSLVMDDTYFIDEIRVEAGITELETILRDEVAAAVDRVRSQNVLRAAISALIVAERDLSDRLAASGAQNDGLTAMQEQVIELQALRQDRAKWPGQLDAEIRKLTVTREDISARRLLEMRHRYEMRLLRATNDEIASIPGEVLAELTALAGELNEMAAERLAIITSELLDDLDERLSLREGIAGVASMTLGQSSTPVVDSNRPMVHGERMALLSELGRGRSLLSLASGSSALAFLAPPFSIVIGLGLGGLFAFQAWRDHSQRNQAANLRVWLQEQISGAQLTIRNAFALQIVDLQQEIRTSVRRVLADRESQLKKSIDEASILRKQGIEQRTKARMALNGRLESMRSLRRETMMILQELGAADG